MAESVADREHWYQSLVSRPTDELVTIWTENDRQQWRSDVFDVVRDILVERGIDPPTQSPPRDRARPPTHVWLGIYAWGVMPLCAAMCLIQARGSAPAVAFSLGWAAVYSSVAYGLHKRRSWAWRLNWFLLGLSAVGFVFLTLPIVGPSPLRFLFLVVAYCALWLGPNFVYFRKRRRLFSDALLEEAR